MNGFKAFLQFSRPHTIIGTSMSVLGLYLIALAQSQTDNAHLFELALALLSCLGANIYIVGLNQITDVQIDRINKPHLPLASGAFSARAGWFIVILFLLLSLGITISQGRYLLITVIASLIIGTVYSLPPFRLKRFHFWAAACIFTVRGAVINVFLFLHFNTILGASEVVPPHVWVLTAFIFGLSLVIAWFKDIPDIDGDRHFRIATLSCHLGPDKVFRLGVYVLTACYLSLIIAGIIGISGVNGPVLALTHLFLLILMWIMSKRVQPLDKTSFTNYYQFIWTLFFCEYIFYATACLLA
jgi:homogentisate phytyltransferase/homogentisate geranylgeranyltransferase